MKKKKKKKWGGGVSVPENGCKSWKMKSIVPDLSEKIMACMYLKRNSVNSLVSICLSDLKDQKLPVSAIKTKLTITDQEFYLPSGLTNGQGSLPVAIMARIGQSGCLLMSKPDSCEIISKFDQRFLENSFKKKKNDPSKNMAFYGRLIFLLWYKIKSLKAF